MLITEHSWGLESYLCILKPSCVGKPCSIITFIDSVEFAVTNIKILYSSALQVFYITVNLNGTSEYTVTFMKIISESHVA